MRGGIWGGDTLALLGRAELAGGGFGAVNVIMDSSDEILVCRGEAALAGNPAWAAILLLEFLLLNPDGHHSNAVFDSPTFLLQQHSVLCDQFPVQQPSAYVFQQETAVDKCVLDIWHVPVQRMLAEKKSMHGMADLDRETMHFHQTEANFFFSSATQARAIGEHITSSVPFRILRSIRLQTLVYTWPQVCWLCWVTVLWRRQPLSI